VREYLAPCVRRATGAKLGLTSGNWCAAAVCAALEACRRPGERAPHGYRAAVVELVQDLMAEGLWRPVDVVRAGRWRPQTGDLAIYDRSVPGRADTAWWRHVNRVVLWREDGTFQTNGGNEAGGGWAIDEHRVGEPRLLGFGEYPRLTVAPQPTCDADPSTLAALARASSGIEGR
jgi:hypothetical protein